MASAIGRCRTAIDETGASTAALFLDASAGNLRHAVSHLGRLAKLRGDEIDEVVGRSLLRRRGGLPAEARSCRHRVEERVDAVCVHSAIELSQCVWIRRSDGATSLAVRGRVAPRRGELWFDDVPGLEVSGNPIGTPSLAVDLAACGALADLASGPVGARLLAQALADGSWLRLGCGTRWFIDDVSACTLVGLFACGGPPRTSDLLNGVIDRDVLARIEGIGWRHVPTCAPTRL